MQRLKEMFGFGKPKEQVSLEEQTRICMEKAVDAARGIDYEWVNKGKIHKDEVMFPVYNLNLFAETFVSEVKKQGKQLGKGSEFYNIFVFIQRDCVEVAVMVADYQLTQRFLNSDYYEVRMQENRIISSFD